MRSLSSRRASLACRAPQIGLVGLVVVVSLEAADIRGGVGGGVVLLVDDLLNPLGTLLVGALGAGREHLGTLDEQRAVRVGELKRAGERVVAGHELMPEVGELVARDRRAAGTHVVAQLVEAAEPILEAAEARLVVQARWLHPAQSEPNGAAATAPRGLQASERLIAMERVAMGLLVVVALELLAVPVAKVPGHRDVALAVALVVVRRELLAADARAGVARVAAAAVALVAGLVAARRVVLELGDALLDVLEPIGEARDRTEQLGVAGGIVIADRRC